MKSHCSVHLEKITNSTTFKAVTDIHLSVLSPLLLILDCCCCFLHFYFIFLTNVISGIYDTTNIAGR